MLRFGLLGPLVVHDGTALAPVAGLKVRVLLAALLLQANRVVPKDALKEAMWGERLPSSVEASFANHATRLRRILSATGDKRLLAVAPGYRLLVRDGELDIEVFEARARAAGLAHHAGDWHTVRTESEAALALWRGEPLVDLSPFSEHRAPSLRVHQLDEARLQVHEWAFDADLHLGRHREICTELAALAAENPLREALHRQLMLALHRSGRQAEAFEVFHALRRSLVDELGTEPGAAVHQAYRELLDRDPEPRPAPPTASSPHQLPSSVPEFTGREAEAAAVLGLLRRPAPVPDEDQDESDGDTDTDTDTDTDSDGRARGSDGHRTAEPLRPVVISGMGGIGKTALAVHVARLARAEFPDGVLYADLRGFSSGGARSAHDVLARFLADLGVRPDVLPDDTDDRAALFRAALEGRRTLLVLDNARDATQVAPLLPSDGPGAALITSRHLLAELPGVLMVTLGPLGPDEQRILLSRLCGADRITDEPAALADILAACGGLPLALRIVGGRLASRPSWPLALLAERLTPHRGRLQALAMGSVAVRHTFDMSYLAMRASDNDLEREAARAFRLLGLWQPHAVTTRSAAALLGATEYDAAAALELLVDANLVHSPEPDAYALHDLLGEYAAQRAAQDVTASERESATLRLLTWYARAVATACAVASHETQSPPPLDGPEDPAVPAFAEEADALAWTKRELPAIREAITRAGALGRSDIAWRLAVGLFGYATTHWWTGEWDACLRQAMDTATAHDDTLGRAWLHRRIAVAHGMANRNDQCLEHLNASLGFFTDAGDELARASILGNVSSLYVQIGDAERGLAHAERSYELYRNVGNAASEALALSRIADAQEMRGEHALAATYYQKVIEALREQRHGVFLATSLTKLGDIHRQLGRREAALEAQTEALTIRQRMNDLGGTADCLAFMARTHHQFGEWDAARACWDQCLELGLRHGMTQHIERSRAGLAALP
ncbi:MULTISPECIES: AfsR/SARP family transcriptional regulator [unclassified Streptomyces]|uniref:AfsR/SARP family transcriptional regulator n=1 Tax=unclassified Streptomyces TaxID=2593676 RepID=UPI002E2E12A5|nr:BTAD domain-containing putative transcriptional regulator [Streptomyces sp. NBC_00273]